MTNPSKDFLKPFTTGNHEFYKDGAFIYEDLGVPLNEDEYQNIFKKITGVKNFLREGKVEYLQKIYDDSKFICDHFKPLYDLGLKEIVIDLTGGAVRDFVLDNHQQIKDLDFMVSYDFAFAESYSDIASIKKEDLLRVGFSEEEIEKYGFLREKFVEKDTDSYFDDNYPEEYERKLSFYTDQFNKLALMCIDRIKGDKEKYVRNAKDMTIDSIEQKDYSKALKDRLSGVVKINSPKMNYPADILLTNLSKAEFLKGFDINLCKTSFCLINTATRNKCPSKFPSNCSHLISRFSSCVEFFADVHNKKLTVVVDEMPYPRIEASVAHIARVQEKYPDFTFNPAMYSSAHDAPQRLAFLKSATMKKEIEESLENKKEEKISKAKMKI